MPKKDAGVRIRVEVELRESFVQASRAQNRAASEVLRDFMRVFTDQHKEGQSSLFAAARQKQR